MGNDSEASTAMTTVFVLLLVISMLIMWVALTSRRYLLASIFFLVSVANLILLVAPRVGFSTKVVLASLGVIAGSLLIGAFNYWLRRHFLSWLKAIRDHNRKSDM
jgi:membrane-associated HD superfamily phosphohydrolase